MYVSTVGFHIPFEQNLQKTNEPYKNPQMSAKDQETGFQRPPADGKASERYVTYQSHCQFIAMLDRQHPMLLMPSAVDGNWHGQHSAVGM